MRPVEDIRDRGQRAANQRSVIRDGTDQNAVSAQALEDFLDYPSRPGQVFQDVEGRYHGEMVGSQLYVLNPARSHPASKIGPDGRDGILRDINPLYLKVTLGQLEEPAFPTANL